jgi:malate dehydrogenase (oxaloacetate-decarboxylating)(NADP+)
MSYEKEALRYHKEPRPGKIEVVPSKPCLSQSDLRLAYTPGAAVLPSIFLSSSPCTISFCETRWAKSSKTFR